MNWECRLNLDRRLTFVRRGTGENDKRVISSIWMLSELRSVLKILTNCDFDTYAEASTRLQLLIEKKKRTCIRILRRTEAWA